MGIGKGGREWIAAVDLGAAAGGGVCVRVAAGAHHTVAVVRARTCGICRRGGRVLGAVAWGCLVFISDVNVCMYA